MSLLNLCVIATAKTEKYKDRLYKFINSYGYKNVLYKNKVKITFLADDSIRPDFVTDNFDWFNFPSIPTSLRFTNYLKNYWSPVLWTMQVDDDSSTDIDKTIEILDQFYDADDSMILMGGRNTDLEQGLQMLVREMGEKNILYDNPDISKFKDIPYFVHAWEPSILSVKAVYKIKNYQKFDIFYDLALKYSPVFTDQSIYLLAKLAKVPIVEGTFLCPFDRPEEYSAINPNSRYSHIHYIKEENNSLDKVVRGMEYLYKTN